jgi:hypothetical protein
MKKFLKNFLCFLLPLILFFLCLETRIRQIPTYLSLKKGFLETQLDEIEVLSTGHSYGNAVNPNFLDRKSFNLFNDAEDLYFNIKVIEKYMEKMPQLKAVLLPISYFSLDYRLEHGPWAWRAPFYKFIFNIPPSDPFSNLNPGYYSQTIAYGWREVLSFIGSNFTDKMENIMHSDGWREVGLVGLIEGKESLRAGQQSIEYLDSIIKKPENLAFNLPLLKSFIEKCKNKNIEVILFTPPAFHSYYDSINPEKYQQMQDEINWLTLKYKIAYFNFLKDARFNAPDFHSIDHVNNLGAEKFSRILNEIINDVLDN